MKTNAFNLNKRSSGILLHPSSLPGPNGIGDFGEAAYQFADFLLNAGQSWWQMFPLGPAGFGHSPYQTLSAFAGNALFISLSLLEKEALLSKHDLKSSRLFISGRVDYRRVIKYKDEKLGKAFARFMGQSTPHKAFAAFCSRHRFWLEDYALFRALRDDQDQAPWWKWEPALRKRHPRAIREAKARLERRIRYHQFLQFKFYQQWTQLKAYCNTLGIGIIGDVPIFVAEDSADVWAHPHLFYLSAKGRPSVVAGVPPDYFSRVGQWWGNPLYRWDVHKRTKYKWWIDRLQMAFRLFDVVRLDHFIGFHNYWSIPATAKTAQEGTWKKGPGTDFFNYVTRALKRNEFIAEDLGVVTEGVKALRDKYGFPGMKILQFAFGTDPEAVNYRPYSYPKNSVVYTGTHDNDTIMGWFRDRGSKRSTRSPAQVRKERSLALEYAHSNGKEFNWDMIRLALASVANISIFPVQDILGLGSEARMNYPGTVNRNWEWRLNPGMLSRRVGDRLKMETETFGRMNSLTDAVLLKTHL